MNRGKEIPTLRGMREKYGVRNDSKDRQKVKGGRRKNE